MTVLQWMIVVAVVAFFICAHAFAFKVVRIQWPLGPRLHRVASVGFELVLIDAPGMRRDRILLLDACVTATTALFMAWRAWRPNDPTLVGVFPLVGVHFVDDQVMDELQGVLFNGRPTAAYLSHASSTFRQVPLAVIRKSLAGEVIGTGQPVIHEILHALLAYFLPDVRERTHDYVMRNAESTYRKLYAPKDS